MPISGGIKSKRHRVAAIVAAALALFSAAAVAAQTRAGTAITNVAQVRADVAGGTITATSNTVSFTVPERLDVSLAPGGHSAPPPVGDVIALPAQLVNRGNGVEAFALTATGPAGLTIRGFAIDADADGVFDPARDPLLTGGTTPALDPGVTVRLFVLVTGGGVADGVVTLIARATTGSGTPGTVFAGAGDGGSDAVVGPTGAEARLDLPLAWAALPTLVKSQAVRAPDGSEQAVPGAVVTYTLQASFPDARRAVRIDDPIPAGARYFPGSLSLDGTALTDAADSDAGSFSGTAVTVSLGDVAPGTRTVRFQAVLQ